VAEQVFADKNQTMDLSASCDMSSSNYVLHINVAIPEISLSATK